MTSTNAENSADVTRVLTALVDGPLSASDIAATTGIEVRGLRTILRSLAEAGQIVQTAPVPTPGRPGRHAARWALAATGPTDAPTGDLPGAAETPAPTPPVPDTAEPNTGIDDADDADNDAGTAPPALTATPDPDPDGPGHAPDDAQATDPTADPDGGDAGEADPGDLESDVEVSEADPASDGAAVADTDGDGDGDIIVVSASVTPQALADPPPAPVSGPQASPARRGPDTASTPALPAVPEEPVRLPAQEAADPDTTGAGSVAAPAPVVCAALTCPLAACPARAGAAPSAPRRRPRAARAATDAPARNASGSVRLRPGQLGTLIGDLLRDNPEAQLSAGTIARELNRSSGAVAAAMPALITAGRLTQVNPGERPALYQTTERR